MSLINCSECKSEVSDKASSCPKCGAPISNVISSSDSSHIWGITSLVLGIGSVTLPFFAIVFLVPASIIFGAIAVQRTKDKLGYIGAALGFVGAVAIFDTSYKINNLFNSVTGSQNVYSNQPSSISDNPIVTLIKYQQIRENMSYSDVNAIVGVIGQEMSSTDISGETVVMYSWPNPDGSNITAFFQNDKLQTKSQFGLK